MFFDIVLDSNEVDFIKIVKTLKPYEYAPTDNEMLQTHQSHNTQLEVVGITETEEVIFKLTNKN